jgi:hypothetical protein
MQTPPIHELPYQDLTEEEKNVLGMWATQVPANVDLAIQLCRGTLKITPKKLMAKAGLSHINSYFLKTWLLPNLVTLNAQGETAYPFAGFANCPIPHTTLKIAGSAVLDGNRDFFGLDKLPNLQVLSADFNNENVFTQAEHKKSTTIVKNGLKSLFNIPNLKELLNFKMDMASVNDIQYLPKIDYIRVCLSEYDIIPFLETIRSATLTTIQIDLNIDATFDHITQNHLHAALRGIFERVPKCFGRPNPNSCNITFRYSWGYERFVENFNKIIYANLRERNKKAPTD